MNWEAEEETVEPEHHRESGLVQREVDTLKIASKGTFEVYNLESVLQRFVCIGV